MARYGFIHDKLDIKLLLLYLMARVATPIDLPALTELAFCDEGVDYFQFSEALNELVSSGHLTLEDEHYAITDKGRSNGSVCETSLSSVIRAKCDRNVAKMNSVLRRDAQVRSEILPREDGTCTLKISLDDNMANLLTVELMTATESQAQTMGERFRSHPEEIYNGILSVLLKEYEEE
ncbi:MAG: DUF4364 family protein [Oscillospiraceae bacterium]